MTRISLSGAWRLRFIPESGTVSPLTDRLHGLEISCEIPGDGHSALLSAGLIPDPYYGRNELSVQELNRGDWIFERSIDLSAELLASGRPFIHFDSIDTVAEVSVNGVEVARSANMFRSVRADLGGILKAGENLIRVVCRSAELEAIRRAGLLDYPIPQSDYPVQSPHRNLLRKVQCHGGWDWGPCLMVAGIYGKAYIGFASPGRIERLSARTFREGTTWKIPVEIEYFVPPQGTASAAAEAAAAFAGGEFSENIEIELSLRAPDASIVASATIRSTAIRSGTNTYTAELEVRDPELWWPSGYGAQPLYTLSASVARKGGTAAREEKRLAFRELRVVAEEDTIGRSLTFRVNGRDIWAKGADWIPMDAFPARQSGGRSRALLEDMIAANMNMVRVWGGGQYESDAFYDACDELGILVWQDMMFACSLYPSNRDFLDDVRSEIAYQVFRLKEHPSIAIWCGNNENVGALNWYPESKAFRDRYVIDYDRLNEGVVGTTIRALDPDRAWWPSSPSAGPSDFTDCWHADNRGDMHFWSVWHEGKPFEAYYGVTPRFCSEFGYQSFPSEEGVASYCPEDERNLTSPVMEHHQKNPRGNSIIIENFSRYFRFPEGFSNMLYLSQVQQALAIKTAVEYWRSRRPVCMGALIWQLNDCWPVASWSSIEYSGKWKLLHYAAARFFAPIATVAYRVGGKVSVFLLNDTEKTVRGRLTVCFYRFDGTTASRKELHVDGAAEASTEVWTAPITELPVLPEEAFLVADFVPDQAVPSAALRTELFLSEPKRCPLVDPVVEAEVIEAKIDGKDALAVRVSAQAPAFYVALDAPGLAGRWEDNFFTVLKGESRTVRFLPRSRSDASADDGLTVPVPSAADLAAALRVTHLKGTYR